MHGASLIPLSVNNENTWSEKGGGIDFEGAPRETKIPLEP
jgi:hypothetical protein